MEVFDAVRTVLAVRQYQSKPVPPETVKRIIEAGHLTASANNRQPWNFILVDDKETISKLAALATTGPYISQAPMVIVVAVENNRFGLSDGSRAIQSMILTAWSEGVGSNWVGFAGMTQIRPLLNIPDTLDVIAILPMGYPAKKLGYGKKNRKPLAEVAHHGRFGQPYTD